MNGAKQVETELVRAFIAERFIRQDIESGIYIANESEMEEFLLEFIRFTVAVVEKESMLEDVFK